MAAAHKKQLRQKNFSQTVVVSAGHINGGPRETASNIGKKIRKKPGTICPWKQLSVFFGKFRARFWLPLAARPCTEQIAAPHRKCNPAPRSGIELRFFNAPILAFATLEACRIQTPPSWRRRSGESREVCRSPFRCPAGSADRASATGHCHACDAWNRKGQNKELRQLKIAPATNR